MAGKELDGSEVRREGCMDGMVPSATRLREALIACGIRGPNLDLLANSDKLTPDIVKQEHASIQPDPRVR
jgi:hypothetical protein